MRAAFVTTYDASDVAMWSGIPHYMTKGFEQIGMDLELIGPLRDRTLPIWLAKKAYYRYFQGKAYDQGREAIRLHDYAYQVAHQLRQRNVSVVISPGTVAVAHLNTQLPSVVWTDATFGGILGFYDSTFNLCKASIDAGHQMEKTALNNVKLAIYSSDWAAKTAVDLYQIDPQKVHVVPFGANVNCTRTLATIEATVEARRLALKNEGCKLLVVGREWHRKGIDVAVDICCKLNKAGVRSSLTIIGCTPPVEVPDFINVMGLVSKRTSEGRAKIDEAYAGSHFFVLPTRADCAPMVVAEASSHGLPVLVPNIGGLPTLVSTGVNGTLLSPAAASDEYVAAIRSTLKDFAAYRALCHASFVEYESRLNWPVACRSVQTLLETHCT